MTNQPGVYVPRRALFLVEYMKIFILAQGRVHTKIQTGFSQKLLCRSKPNFI